MERLPFRRLNVTDHHYSAGSTRAEMPLPVTASKPPASVLTVMVE